MTTMIKIPYSKEIREIVNQAFPKYRGRKCYLSVCSEVTLHSTYWSEGSRSYWCAVNLSNLQFGHLKGTNVFPSFSQVEGLTVPLARNVALFEHAYRGMSQWIHIHCHPDSLSDLAFSNPQLPSN